MINLDSLKKIAQKWGTAVGHKFTQCPPEAKFRTGDQRIDAQCYYFEKESGLEIKLSSDYRRIVSYNVVDDKKFSLFLLRWS